MTVRRRMAWLAVVLVVVDASCGLREALGDDSGPVAERAVNAVVQVVVYRKDHKLSMGTGFLFRDKKTIITNYHVIANAAHVYAKFQNLSNPMSPQTVTIECDRIDSRPGLDLAALRLKDNEKPPDGAVALEPESDGFIYRLLHPVLLIGDAVTGEGEDRLNLVWSAHEGRIAAAERRRADIAVNLPNEDDATVVQFDLTTAQGMSGSPILGLDGRLIGVFFAGVDLGQTRFSFGLPHRFVHRLNFQNPVQPFDRGDGIPDLQQRGPGTLVLKSATEPLLQIKGATPGANQANWNIAVGAVSWGAVPGDPEFIFNNLVGDTAKFQEHVPRNLLAGLLAKHRAVLITNPFFNFNLLVPDHFEAEERVPPGLANTLFTDFVNRAVEEPFGRVKIATTKIPVPPWDQQERLNVFARVSEDYIRLSLLLRVENRQDQPGEPAPADTIRLIPELSDAAPRFHISGRVIRLWRRFQSLNDPDRHYMILSALDDDVHLTAAFVISLAELANSPDNTVDRFFITSSIAFPL